MRLNHLGIGEGSFHMLLSNNRRMQWVNVCFGISFVEQLSRSHSCFTDVSLSIGYVDVVTCWAAVERIQGIIKAKMRLNI